MTIDESQVVRLEEIGGPALVVNLIDIVLQELPGRIAGVHSALARRDHAALGSAAHSVVSGTGHFGPSASPTWRARSNWPPPAATGRRSPSRWPGSRP